MLPRRSFEPCTYILSASECWQVSVLTNCATEGDTLSCRKYTKHLPEISVKCPESRKEFSPCIYFVIIPCFQKIIVQASCAFYVFHLLFYALLYMSCHKMCCSVYAMAPRSWRPDSSLGTADDAALGILGDSSIAGAPGSGEVPPNVMSYSYSGQIEGQAVTWTQEDSQWWVTLYTLPAKFIAKIMVVWTRNLSNGFYILWFATWIKKMFNGYVVDKKMFNGLTVISTRYPYFSWSRLDFSPVLR